MLSSSQRRLVRGLCRIHDLMMLTYPSAFRHEYGHEMALAFDNRARDIAQREGGWALLPFMLHIMWDWLQTVARERTDMQTNVADMSYPDPDRQSRALWLMLTAVGALLMVVGWSRWLNP